MLDKEYIEKSSWYTSVADAIRNKKGTTDPILRDDFASEISSISVGEETPYYDGTVIIEKAESVLGLRRFKESVNSVKSISIADPPEVYQEFYNTNSFDIEPITFEGETITKMCCAFTSVESGEAIIPIFSPTFDWGPLPISELTELGLTIFTATSTANNKVDEWLRNNTEPINLLGKRRFKETIELPEWNGGEAMDFQWQCNFIHNDIQYNVMGVLAGSFSRIIFGYANLETENIIMAYYDDEGWQDETYRIIDLLTVPYNSKIINWLLANTEGVSV